MAQEITKKELQTLISDEVKAILTAEGMGKVVDLVNERIEKAISPLRQEATDWQAKIFGAIAPRREDPAIKTEAPTGRIARAIGIAKQDGTGFEGTLKVLKAWGSPDLADALVDARQKALAASTADQGGYIVAEQYSTDVQELRRARTVVRGSMPRVYPMPTGTLHLPKVASGATGTYIGENANATHSNLTLGENVLTWKKLAVTSALSNDLIRYASPAADAMVRDDVARSLNVTEDAALIRADGTGGQPKGLRYWASAANIIAAATTSLANVSTDMGKLILQLQNNNVPDGNWGWIMSPRSRHYLNTVQNSNGYFAFRDEITQGKFYGFPYKVTTNIPITLTVGANSDTSEVYLINWDDMALGDSMRLAIDVSTEAAYYDGSAVVSSWSRDQFVVRAVTEHDFVARDPNAIAILTGVRWGV